MPLKIKELPESERPYEKLEKYGEKALSNAELLAIIIKNGTKEDTSVSLAQKVLNLGNTNDLRFLHEISLEELQNIKGIGKVKAIQIKALAEITKRIAKPINMSKIQIRSSKDIASLLMEEMRYEKRELVKLVILNVKNIVLKIIDVSDGGTNFAILEPKHVLKEPIKMQAPKIILVHNHPSGNPTPSKEDYETTERIKICSKIMGIELIDHIVIGDGTYQSIMETKE